ncbi:bifunctional diguanylate cyclase/phosphodiesterase [Bacillus sp. FJAT-42315]|uniref:bifunctional diguanylate cyclase/phosphodiesterase n=1 Tax=Bacillus sp. FJAT-42315 TaxID=2014077 RepID=UPI000C244DDC|nr:EAL domain-containing protein [Bacillus sp. FJAT-42315]
MGRKHEIRSIVILTGGLLSIVMLYQLNMIYKDLFIVTNFLSFHTALELLSIAVAFAVALQGWLIFPHTLSKHRLFISAAFLSIGIFDLFHVLTYKGMPFFLTESSSQNATWFWIVARLTLAISLLAIYSREDQITNKRFRNHTFALFSLYSLVISFIIFTFSDKLPLLVIHGVGLTPLKKGIEYFVCFLFLFTIILIFEKYRDSKKKEYLPLIIALSLSLYSELIFTLYNHVYDWMNLLGHVFKVSSYYFFLKGIYVATIEKPYLEQKQIQKALEESEHRLNTIVNMVPTGITITNTEGKHLFINHAAKKVFGIFSDGQIHPSRFKTLAGKPYPEEKQAINLVKATGEAVYDVMYKLEQLNGEHRILSVNSAPIFDKNQKIVQIINSITDMTEQIEAQNKVNFLAYYDELTGLPNRFYLKKQLSERLESGCGFSLLVINLNRFKHINESLGRQIGDLFLIEAANRLQAFASDQGMTAVRLTGDEFAILCDTCDSNDCGKVDMCAKQIVDLFHPPFIVKGLRMRVQVTVGATFSTAAADIDELLNQAMMAITEARKMNRSIMIYRSDMEQKAYEQIVLEHDLSQAIERKQLSLHYQPQIDLETGQLVGAEALIRWHHPEKGMISPATFIPLAESTGLILPIGTWVIEEACRQLRQWLDDGLPTMRISVNLSLRQFFQNDLTQVVSNALTSCRLQPDQLELEITESMTLNLELALKKLNKLKKLGVQIAVDDFGTGYSSLSYLHQFPVDRLKIDQSFVQHLFVEKHGEAIVETILSMGQNLGLELIAEGVETEEQMTFLKHHHCHQVQGYYISKPLPAEEFSQLVRNRELSK